MTEHLVTFTKHKTDDRLPVLGRKVLAETKTGEQYMAVRYESKVTKNAYFWGLVFNGNIIGNILDVVAWYEQKQWR
jgi:hypothetical protein